MTGPDGGKGAGGRNHDRAATLAKLDAKLHGLLETSRANRVAAAEQQGVDDATQAAIAAISATREDLEPAVAAPPHATNAGSR